MLHILQKNSSSELISALAKIPLHSLDTRPVFLPVSSTLQTVNITRKMNYQQIAQRKHWLQSVHYQLLQYH